MGLLRGWRPALRIARREALRARGRSALVLAMIALPVTGVVALDTLYRTSDVSVVEGLDRNLGGADALVEFQGARGPVQQSPDGQRVAWDGNGRAPAATAATIRSVLGPGTHVVRRTDGEVLVRTRAGVATPSATEVDLTDPMTRGLFALVAGRLPRSAQEVAVSPALAARGFPVGSELRTVGSAATGRAQQVVGTVESAERRDTLLVVGTPGSLGLRHAANTGTFLVGHPGGVSWSDVRALNHAGIVAVSRQVLADPPPDPTGGAGGPTSDTLAVVGLIAAMALLEVVLLAGPAFAVGARRQQRSLALMAAGGARPRDVRRTVLASGLVLGSAGAVLGAGLGVAVARVAEPFVQRFSHTWFGPFEVSARDLVAVVVCGLLSALLAALAPAWLATRMDVVAVLAGRRGEGRPSRRSPVLGLVLLAAGVLGSVSGARRPSGANLIALSAVVAVLGVVLLVPLVVATLGRIAHRLPLTARYALRDAARQRARTAPAVAAVAATVAGVIALGIGASSDAAEQAGTYSPRAPEGAAVVNADDLPTKAAARTWSRLRAATERAVPGGHVVTVRGLPSSTPEAGLDVTFRARGAADSYSWDNAYNGGVLVATGGTARLGLRLSPAQARRADAVLARGGAVVFRSGPRRPVRATAVVNEYAPDTGRPTGHTKTPVRAVFMTVPGENQAAEAVVAPGVAERLGMPVRPIGLLVTGTSVDDQAEQMLREATTAVTPTANVYVERGYHDDTTAVVLLILGGVGGLLMLGGTLTATFLALSEARPDLATLAAVGAAPRVRRRVAAGYAGVIGLVGGVLGAAVGFVPGLAVTYPLTSTSWRAPGTLDATGSPLPDHFVDVPWVLVVGVVVLLPLVTALVVGLAARSRLPLAARLT